MLVRLGPGNARQPRPAHLAKSDDKCFQPVAVMPMKPAPEYRRFKERGCSVQQSALRYAG
ncbi:MAG: hypothetical protein H6981_14945 [Gammaproteobacteria bacterium]|nr:hypothetical protein [Gammaproteobacteria bacterium]MCP5138082.1 hypothetical protein [Gammaproteobacteria bacterium]